MLDLIVIAGAPGSGKSTICNILKDELDSPMITYGHIRGFHLNSKWSNATFEDDKIAFENVRFIVDNYLKNGYRNVILNDLEEHWLEQIPIVYGHLKYVICTLFVDSDQELEGRVLDETRDSGFRDFKSAIEWNGRIKQRRVHQYEYIVDNSSKDFKIAVDEILEIINLTPNI